ncbi:MAG: phosphoribosylanthranilate isomerase [Chitinispirillaceae bacterium]|nr:phosphoribosylanthranilate isomerase [Chitinispirillaceae bacterium]
MFHTRIKLCGITRIDDAHTAAQLGVDALGFIFVKKSPRYITPENAAAIISDLPPFISRVGVFADEEAESIIAIAREAGLDTIQLHGSETPAFCRHFPYPVIKALGLRADFDMSSLTSYPVAGILLDTWSHGLQGGSGRTGDWNLARKIADRYGRIILAGGLGPSNLEAALAAVRPYAVDLNSGVEIMPGRKNPHKLREAINIIKTWRTAP